MCCSFQNSDFCTFLYCLFATISNKAHISTFKYNYIIISSILSDIQITNTNGTDHYKSQDDHIWKPREQP